MLKKDKFSEDKLKKAFELFDKNNDGYISAEEISNVLSSSISDIDKPQWDQMVQ